jgi:hypothetical protein
MAVIAPSVHYPVTRPGTRHPAHGRLGSRLVELARALHHDQYQLVITAAAFAESGEWLADGASSAGAWLAAMADVEACTAREWIRIGRTLNYLPVIAAHFAAGRLSYAKVRILTRVATAGNEAELAALAQTVPASDLGCALAGWRNRHHSGAEIDAYHHQQRSLRWRTDPDGMVTFTIRVPPHLAATLIAVLTALVWRTKPARNPDATWPNLAQQHADALVVMLNDGAGRIDTELVLHVRGDGATCDDGTPVTDTVIADLAPESFLRALIHDAEGRPINASARHRHPTTRQKRVVKERDRACIDCGRHTLLHYDHNPPFHHTRRTVIDEPELRCAPCHRQRHHPTG